jgi:hypothetical protein
LVAAYKKYELYIEFPSYEDADSYFKEEKRVIRAEVLSKAKQVKQNRNFAKMNKQKILQAKKLESINQKRKFLDDRKKELEIRAKRVL